MRRSGPSVFEHTHLQSYHYSTYPGFRECQQTIAHARGRIEPSERRRFVPNHIPHLIQSEQDPAQPKSRRVTPKAWANETAHLRV